MYQVTRFKWQPKATSKNDVYNALQPAIRYEKAQCLDLPEVVYQTREVPLMAQRGEVTVFAISTNRSGVQEKGDRVLKYLAEETGGRASFPFSASDLAADFQEIARELRSQYSLAYISTNTAHDGTYRAIAIQSRDKNYRVRAKSGYFAPSQ